MVTHQNTNRTIEDNTESYGKKYFGSEEERENIEQNAKEENEDDEYRSQNKEIEIQVCGTFSEISGCFRRNVLQCDVHRIILILNYSTKVGSEYLIYFNTSNLVS